MADNQLPMKSEATQSRPGLLKFILVVVLVLLVPVIPFVIVGEQSERWVVENLLTGSYLAGGSVPALLAVVAVLASDILLPVPSSGVMTYTGAALGWLAGSAICFVGLMLSCLIGYLLGRYFGLPLVRRFVSENELQEMAQRLEKPGLWVVAGFRGVPVLAEASVLVAGVGRMTQRSFWIAVTVANLCIALIYNALGHYARDAEWLAYALVISIVLPLMLLLAWWVVRKV
jgi:uncharacterized membrane protein YdjX (TVP38/TMEM64 family)